MAKQKSEVLILQDTAWVSYISPFRLIVPDDEQPLEVSLEEINNNTYDHGQLCRIVGMLPTLAVPDYKMVVCYDGALAIPVIKAYEKQEAVVNFFNGILCQLLLGGIFCEALDQRDIVSGSLHKKKYLWPVNFGESASTHFHSKLRMRVASNLETISLANPSVIRYSEFIKALNVGKLILDKVYNLTPAFLMRGVTEVKYRNWSLALSSLWITIEQLTDYLWNEQFLGSETFQPNTSIPGRIKALREDHRTWSSSVKQEILFQAKLIDQDLFRKLYPVRQARNRLVHDGKDVEQNEALSAYEAVVGLLKLCTGDNSIPIREVNLLREKQTTEVSVERRFDDWIKISQKY